MPYPRFALFGSLPEKGSEAGDVDVVLLEPPVDDLERPGGAPDYEPAASETHDIDALREANGAAWRDAFELARELGEASGKQIDLFLDVVEDDFTSALLFDPQTGVTRLEERFAGEGFFTEARETTVEEALDICRHPAVAPG